MEEARLRTNLILIENYQDTRLNSACLIFSELIGADVFKLKLNVHLMPIVAEHYQKRGMGETEAIEKCSNQSLISSCVWCLFKKKQTCYFLFFLLKRKHLCGVFQGGTRTKANLLSCRTCYNDKYSGELR